MKKIIHIDMDCFYAQVEMRDNPEYREIPLAVGGEGKRSVLSTCNYLARKFGVRSAMPAIKAKQLCPHLKIVHGRMQVYHEVSMHIREIFSRYTQLVEPLSLDEAFLDVTDCCLFNGSATLIAQDIRNAIWHELQLTASAGIAPNKFLAKIASDENKPNGQCVVSPDKVNEFIEVLPLRKIPGIGPKTSEKLASFGATTCADIRALSIKELTPLVGSFAERLFNYSFGVDNREVKVNRVRKSVGVEHTFADDLVTVEECIAQIPKLIDKMKQRLQKHQDRVIAKQGVKIKFADFTLTTMEQQSLALDEDGMKNLMESAFQRGNGKTVRLLGVFVAFAELPNDQEGDERHQQLGFVF
ncbi:DNA polymerase IV [Thalassotalea sp. M1531]|uniref:DNA polymerase IV n=1 Tax=Thalassotalea algicola TaxID=2716224 RepID=A0A7Y0LCT8_9GAMM|nr:DNA polymerase IV [Thalassotalea algicola]NMP32203.1 DNA polymerase IV [Thalassotalea algicola]